MLAYLEDKLDIMYQNYADINGSILKGLDGYITKIPTKNGYIEQFTHHNLIVTLSGIKKKLKPFPPEFHNFDDYYGYLQKKYQQIFYNARSKIRTKKVGIFSTQSKGYDSTAVNAIASRHTIDKVFHLR